MPSVAGELNRKTENWKSPLNRILWLNALRKKAPQVTLRDGRVFNINYDVRPLVYKSTGEVVELVRVEPANDEHVPYGFFDLKRCTNLAWITEDLKKVTHTTAEIAKLETELESVSDGQS